jgi:nicotinate-nucleotide pyrophosphorylase
MRALAGGAADADSSRLAGAIDGEPVRVGKVVAKNTGSADGGLAARRRNLEVMRRLFGHT